MKGLCSLSLLIACGEGRVRGPFGIKLVIELQNISVSTVCAGYNLFNS
tara:strand:+ start:3986 stop:4129 length:144 start_codon:yes stop_codon:yes gene_type:complete